MPTTILLYGPTGSGKTTQIGLLAEDVYTRTGRITRVATADFGGTDTLDPYVDEGIIEVIPLGASNIWIWLHKVVTGHVRSEQGAWVLDPARNQRVGVLAFESAHGIAQLLRLDMEQRGATGIAIGGDTNSSFDITADGETRRIGHTKGYQKFAIPQSEILNAMYASFRHPVDVVVWTAGMSKEEDEVSVSQVIGPDVIGKALTPVLPKDFNYTFRLGIVPARPGQAEEHVLYLGNHLETQGTRTVMALGNIRRPLDAPPPPSQVIRPANMVQALKIIRHDARTVAREAIRKRVAAAATAQAAGRR